MFSMTVEQQMNLNERTLLLGKPQFDKIPEQIGINQKKIAVIGISNGVAPPFMSLEIELIKDNIVGKTITNVN